LRDAGAKRRRPQRLAAGPAAPGRVCRSEKYQQLHHLHPTPFIRHVLKAFRHGSLTAAAAAEQLGHSRSRLYFLFSRYLDALSLPTSFVELRKFY
jgi:hypothetical protein